MDKRKIKVALEYAMDILMDQASKGLYPQKALAENGGRGFEPITEVISELSEGGKITRPSDNTDIKVGDKVRIIANRSNHGFNIDEVVTIVDVFFDEEGEQSFKAFNEEEERRYLDHSDFLKFETDELRFTSTDGMTPLDAPKGKVLAKYLEPSFGGWHCQYCIAYFDGPDGYEDPSVARGWTHDISGNNINVVEYMELPHIDQENENPFFMLSQMDVKDGYGTFTPNLGCIKRDK